MADSSMIRTVSVIVPAHQGRAKTLGRTLDAVGTQTGNFELEIIVVDDASPDDAIRKVAEAASGQYPGIQVKFVRRAVNGGLAASLNFGLDIATGALIAFCDSDDEFVPSRLARQLDVAESAGDVVVSGSLIWQPQSSPVRDPLINADESDLLFHRFGVSKFPHLYPRAVFESHRFDPKLRSWEDWDLSYNLVRAGIEYVDSGSIVGVVNDDTSDRLSQSVTMAEGLEYLLSKYHTEIGAHRGCRAAWEFRIGRRFALSGAPDIGLRWILRSLRHDPVQPRRVAYALRLARKGVAPAWDPYP